MLKTSIGPRGQCKLIWQAPPMLPKITSDGKSIFTYLGTLHPAANILRDLAFAQAAIGDGVLSTVVLAGELLKQAKRLLDLKLHPSIIVKGYLLALHHALETLDRLAIPATWEDRDLMFKVAATAGGTKAAGLETRKLAEAAATALQHVVELRNGKPIPQLGSICVLKKVGGSIHETRLVRGMVFDRPLLDPTMPRQIQNPRIAILKCGLEFRKWHEQPTPLKVQVKPGEMKKLLDTRWQMATDQVNHIVNAGANVVVTKHGCDPPQTALCAQHGIQVITRVADEGGVGRLAKATGGQAVTMLEELAPEHLGHAAEAKEVQWGDSKLFVIDGCRDPRAVTIVVRGAVESIVDESERALDSALAACSAIVKDPRVVGGAGAIEAELARHLRSFALTRSDTTQLAVLAVANALEELVAALAENSGFNPLDSVLAMRAAHNNGGRWLGLDLWNHGLQDAVQVGLIEPVLIKESVLKSAVETACQVVRIDKILAAFQALKYFPEEIPGPPDLGPRPVTQASDLPEETKKRMKQAPRVRVPGMRQTSPF
jgi:chaperonin GroEL (HSP60 family)